MMRSVLVTLSSLFYSCLCELLFDTDSVPAGLHMLQRRAQIHAEFSTDCRGPNCDFPSAQGKAAMKRHQAAALHRSPVEIAYDEGMKAEALERSDSLVESSVVPILDSDYNMSYVNWSLCNASFHSNLGGLGPDSGEEALRYYNITSAGGGHSVDMVVTVNEGSTYEAKDSTGNGLVDDSTCFGRINVKSGTVADLMFSWVYHGTDTPVALRHSYFTVYDVDSNMKATTQEKVTFYDRVHEIFVHDNHTMSISGSLDSGLTFLSTAAGNGDDNPLDPENLTYLQQTRAITVDFFQRSQFRLTLTVASGKKNQGRNFAFGGHSNLAPVPTPAPTEAPTAPVPAPAPSQAPTEAPTVATTAACANWCGGNTHPWDRKCQSMDACKQCSSCEAGRCCANYQWNNGGTCVLQTGWCGQQANCGGCDGHWDSGTTTSAPTPAPTPATTPPTTPGGWVCNEVTPGNSDDCHQKWENAVKHGETDDLCNTCETEVGDAPLRSRCLKCCEECGGPDYVLGAEGRNSCPGGSQKITTEGDCATAANDFHFVWGLDYQGKRGDRPGGCWRGDGGRANWNQHPGSGHSSARVICKKQPTPSPTTPPETTPPPTTPPTDKPQCNPISGETCTGLLDVFCVASQACSGPHNGKAEPNQWACGDISAEKYCPEGYYTCRDGSCNNGSSCGKVGIKFEKEACPTPGPTPAPPPTPPTPSPTRSISQKIKQVLKQTVKIMINPLDEASYNASNESNPTSSVR